VLYKRQSGGLALIRRERQGGKTTALWEPSADGCSLERPTVPNTGGFSCLRSNQI